MAAFQPCSWCVSSGRAATGRLCVACQERAAKEAQSAERRRERARRRYAANPEPRRGQVGARRAADPEKARAQNREHVARYQESHSELVNQRKREAHLRSVIAGLSPAEAKERLRRLAKRSATLQAAADRRKTESGDSD
jgi:hypothetical protein